MISTVLLICILAGFEVHSPDIDQPFTLTVHAICFSCDLPARALVQNFIQFNGIYGCCFCEQPGVVVSTDKGGNVTTFPYQQEDPNGPARSQQKCIEHAMLANINHNTVCCITFFASVQLNE